MVSWQEMMSGWPDDFFFELLPFADFGIENLKLRYLKNYYSK